MGARRKSRKKFVNMPYKVNEKCYIYNNYGGPFVWNKIIIDNDKR